MGRLFRWIRIWETRKGQLTQMVYINTGKGYEHYNRALGKRIRSKSHYQEEMKRQGMIPKEAADEIARKRTERKPYTPSQDARDIINSLRPDKKGNVRMSDRAIDKLKDMGMTTDKDKIQRHIKDAEQQGGM